MDSGPDMLHRGLIPVIMARMSEEPVILLEGPRTVGKSTLLRACAQAHGTNVNDLDDVDTRRIMAEDPRFFTTQPGPVFIDEYQKVPEVLDAIKAELNKDTRPGRFVLAGSTRHQNLPRAAQALTGRLHRLPVYPFTQAEIDRTESNFVARLISNDPLEISGRSSTEREEYIQRVLRGGLPLAIAREGRSRTQWFQDYVDLTINRDIREITDIRHADGLKRLLARLASQTAQILRLGAAGNDLELSANTSESYAKLLEAVFLLYRLPAWDPVGFRAAKKPKVHITDSGVAATLLNIDKSRLDRRDTQAYNQFGHLLESFVVGEVMRQASWLDEVIHSGHWRSYTGDEVDLILQRSDGCVVAIEVKGSSSVGGDAFAPMRALQTKLGDSFLRGIVFFLGEYSRKVDDGLYAVSVDQLWASEK